jgi:hypothetical protein
VQEDDLNVALGRSFEELGSDLSSIPDEKGDFAYAPGKWTICQLLQHAIDTERIFAYRALCIARGETQPLPGFDENEYARMAGTGKRTPAKLKEEFLTVRQSTLQLFGGFDDAALARCGTANGNPISVHALAYIIVGHWRHHAGILRERYGI